MEEEYVISRLCSLLSVLTANSFYSEHLGFESPRVLNAIVITSRHLLLRKIKYGQFECTSGTVVFSMSETTASAGNASVQILTSLHPTQLIESESLVGPCSLYFNIYLKGENHF